MRALERELKFLLQQNNGGSGGIFLLSGVKSPRLTPIGGNETAGGDSAKKEGRERMIQSGEWRRRPIEQLVIGTSFPFLWTKKRKMLRTK